MHHSAYGKKITEFVNQKKKKVESQITQIINHHKRAQNTPAGKISSIPQYPQDCLFFVPFAYLQE